MDKNDERWQFLDSGNPAIVGPFTWRCAGSSRGILETPDKTQPVTNRAQPYNAGQQQEYSGSASRFHVIKLLLRPSDTETTSRTVQSNRERQIPTSGIDRVKASRVVQWAGASVQSTAKAAKWVRPGNQGQMDRPCGEKGRA